MITEDPQRQGLLVSGRFPELEDALCERVRELRVGSPLAPLTVVVGSAHVRTRIGDLLVRRLGAVANVSVITLAAFAHDLAAGGRTSARRPLSGLARERLVRRLIAARELQYFAPVRERPHFPQAVAATIADLREGCVPAAAPWAHVAFDVVAAGPTSRDQAKAADLQGLYAAYCGELERRGLGDGAHLLLDAAEAVRQETEPGRPRIILYGFYDLNQAQQALVAELLRAGADLLVPVPRGGSRDGVGVLEAALAAGLAEQRVDAPGEGCDLGRLAELWGTSSRASGQTVDLRGDGSLTVVSVPDERAEMREAVRVVLDALAGAGGASGSWDCAVVVPHGDDVERAATALGAAGIPVACRSADRSAGPRVLRLMADCLAPPAGEPFARRAVVDLLSAAPLLACEASPREIALWLDEARQAGVTGGVASWRERVERRLWGLERDLAGREATSDDLAADDDEGAGELDDVRLHLGAARSLKGALDALWRGLADLPPRACWGTWAAILGAAAKAVFEAPVAVAVRDAAGRLAALDVLDEEVDVSEMASVLREQLAGARMPVGRVGRAGVAVLTPLELRGLRFHTVVFAGLAEGGFPARGRPDPVLGDAARKRLAERLGARLPLAEARDAESTLLFAFACEAAQRLTLLVPRTDAASGRPRLPSRLLMRLASLAHGGPVGIDDFKTGEPLAAVWRNVGGAMAAGDAKHAGLTPVDAGEYDTVALLALSQRGGAPAAQAYLADVLGDAGAASRRLGQWSSARELRPGSWDGVFGEDARKALLARHPFDGEMSPTRLERYVACPFAFLLRDVLHLAAPEEPGETLEMEPRELGKLAHGILQDTYAAPASADRDLEATLQALAAAYEAGCAEAERRGVTGVALSWEVRREMLRDDLRESVRRDPVFALGEGRPAHVEWSFGEAAGRPVTLELPSGRTIRFRGRLDRVDVTAAGARVVDYKTGKGTTEAKLLRDGLSVQLPVYQLAVRQAGDADYAEIECLYRLVTRRGGFGELRLQDAEAVATRRLRRLVTTAVELVERGLFPRAAAGRCDYCDVAYACGSTTWTRDRKGRHELLAELVGLQRHGPAEEAGDGAA